MAKFRSWNEELKEFVYFENGFYRTMDGYILRAKIPAIFDWQNAEQEFTREGITFFEGDKFLLEQEYYGVITLKESVLVFKVYDRDTNEFKGYEDVADSYISKMERLGNIHKGEK